MEIFANPKVDWLGKKWIFKEIGWKDYERDKLPEKARILKRDRGNLDLTRGN